MIIASVAVISPSLWTDLVGLLAYAVVLGPQIVSKLLDKRAPRRPAQAWGIKIMTVMITGGMGAMGSATAHRLVEMGHTPVIFDMFEDYSLLADIKDKVIFQQGSVLDQAQMVERHKGARGHQAGAHRGPFDQLGPQNGPGHKHKRHHQRALGGARVQA